jgi:hypothetical protein
MPGIPVPPPADSATHAAAPAQPRIAG